MVVHPQGLCSRRIVGLDGYRQDDERIEVVAGKGYSWGGISETEPRRVD